jgi:hypothetical protein
VSYPDGTPERELQLAVEDLNAAVEKVVRLNGSVPDNFYIQDWAVIGAATRVDDNDTIIMFAVPGVSMATYQLHGLIDLADRWIVVGPDSQDMEMPEDDLQ